jgi:hypothetical protein
MLKNSPPVIPGRREAAGPESRTPEFPAFLDSGLAPSARSGMTLWAFSVVGWAKALQRRAHAFLLGATTWARRFRGFAHPTH